jgi:chromosome segregation ATPase
MPGKPRRPRLAHVWRRIVLLQRGYADLNQATGGAFGFNTVAKILAWAGICAIVFLLLHKVHQIQQELDPVGQGLQQLQQQLRSARTSVATGTQASEQELEALRARAHRLDASLATASKTEHDQSEPSLLKARTEARDLADALAKEADGLQQISAERELFARSLGDYRDALHRGEEAEAAQISGLADGGAIAEGALRELSSAASRTAARVDGEASHLQLDQLAATIQALQSRLADLERQVDRVNRQLASTPPPPRPQAARPQVTATASLATAPTSR